MLFPGEGSFLARFSLRFQVGYVFVVVAGMSAMAQTSAVPSESPQLIRPNETVERRTAGGKRFASDESDYAVHAQRRAVCTRCTALWGARLCSEGFGHRGSG